MYYNYSALGADTGHTPADQTFHNTFLYYVNCSIIFPFLTLKQL